MLRSQKAYGDECVLKQISCLFHEFNLDCLFLLQFHLDSQTKKRNSLFYFIGFSESRVVSEMCPNKTESVISKSVVAKIRFSVKANNFETKHLLAFFPK